MSLPVLLLFEAKSIDAYIGENKKAVEVNKDRKTFRCFSIGMYNVVLLRVDLTKGLSYATYNPVVRGDPVLFGVRLSFQSEGTAQIGFVITTKEKSANSFVLFDLLYFFSPFTNRRYNEFILLNRRVPIHSLPSRFCILPPSVFP